MQGKNRTKELVKYCKLSSIDHYLRSKKRKHVNDELLDIHVPHVDEQHQEPEIVEDDEQDLNLEMEDDAEMEQLQAQQGENCSTSDLFSAVMPKEHTGRVRLVGKGVTKSDLKASSSSTSTVIDGITVKVPVDLVKSITTSVKYELTREILSTILIDLRRVIPNLDSILFFLD
ncbi:hypothetical protein Dimus_020385 [Dionaea muscipula]